MSEGRTGAARDNSRPKAARRTWLVVVCGRPRPEPAAMAGGGSIRSLRLGLRWPRCFVFHVVPVRALTPHCVRCSGPLLLRSPRVCLKNQKHGRGAVLVSRRAGGSLDQLLVHRPDRNTRTGPQDPTTPAAPQITLHHTGSNPAEHRMSGE